MFCSKQRRKTGTKKAKKEWAVGHMVMPVDLKAEDMLFHSCLPVKDEKRCFASEPSASFVQFLQREGFAQSSFVRGFLNLLGRRHAPVAVVFPGMLYIRLAQNTFTPSLEFLRHVGKQSVQLEPFAEKDLVKALERCDKKFFVMYIAFAVDGKKGGHANALIFNTHTKTVEHFEPHGSHVAMGPHSAVINQQLGAVLETLLRRLGFNHYKKPIDTCPRLKNDFSRTCAVNEFGQAICREGQGPQAILNSIEPVTSQRTQVYMGQLNGTCAMWSLWAMHLRLLFFADDSELQTLLTRALQVFQKNNYVTLGEFIQEFIWEIYQDLDIREESQTVALNKYITAVPTDVQVIKIEGRPMRFARTLGDFLDAHPDVMQNFFLLPRFEEAWNVLETNDDAWHLLDLPGFSTVELLPFYPLWSARYASHVKAGRQQDAEHYLNYIQLDREPLRVIRGSQPNHCTTYPNTEVLDFDPAFAVARWDACAKSHRLQSEAEGIPGYETIAQVPGYLKNRLKLAEIPRTCLCTKDGRSLQCQPDFRKFAPLPVDPDDEKPDEADMNNAYFQVMTFGAKEYHEC